MLKGHGFNHYSLPGKSEHRLSENHSMHDTSTDASIASGCRDIELDPSAYGNEINEDRWDEEELETNRAEEELCKDCDKDNKSILSTRPKNKRSLSMTEEQMPAKSPTKHRRFSSPSPLLSDEDSEMRDESHLPSESHQNKSTQVNLLHSSDSCATSDDEDEGSWTPPTIIYEQQSWEGKIIDEKEMRIGRGKPRKLYRVRWKSSWVDERELGASGLVYNWRVKKASRSRN